MLQLCKQVVGQIFSGVWFDSACVIGLLRQPYCLSLERLCNEEAVVTALKLPLVVAGLVLLPFLCCITLYFCALYI